MKEKLKHLLSGILAVAVSATVVWAASYSADTTVNSLTDVGSSITATTVVPIQDPSATTTIGSATVQDIVDKGLESHSYTDGPASSTAGDFPSFTDTTGKALSDSGYSPSSFESATSDNIDPDRLAGDTVDDNKIDASILAISSIDIQYDVSTSSGHALASDTSYTGMPVVGINAGEALTFGDVVYLGSAGTWLKADNTSSTTYPCWGIAVATVASGAEATVLTKGYVRSDSWTWSTRGELLYLGTSGAMTATAPTGSGDAIQPLARVVQSVTAGDSADIIYFKADPMMGWTVHS